MLQTTAGKLGAEPLSVFDVTVAIGLSWFASIAKIPRRCRLATV